MRHKGNPWGLTLGQVVALDAIVSTGSYKGAAYQLGLTLKTIDSHATAAKRLMGARTLIQMVLIYDRWRRDAPDSAVAAIELVAKQETALEGDSQGEEGVPGSVRVSRAASRRPGDQRRAAARKAAVRATGQAEA